MENSVVFKGNNDGITIVLDDKVEFKTIEKHLKEKIIGAKSFFDKAKMSITFKGRILESEEIEKIVNIFSENSTVNITYVKEDIDMQNASLDIQKEDMATKFFRKTLRSGQKIVFSGSIVIMGDVNPGAEIFAEGNIIVLGALRGLAHAGYTGDKKTFIVALDMKPTQLRIADAIARGEDEKNEELYAKMAYIDSGSIYIEKVDKKAFNNLA